MANLNFYTYTSKGPRENNQDSLCALRLQEDIHFFAVADGMGGGRAGNVASKIVINKAQSYLVDNIPDKWDAAKVRNILHRIFTESQIEIQKNIEIDKELNGMGTTLTCILFYKNKYVWGNIGDSRIYRLYDDYIEQITKDHSYISDIDVDDESKQSISSNYGHILTKAIDGGIDEPDIYPLDKEYEVLDQPVSFILCSDGLITDKSNSDERDFLAIYQQTETLEEISTKLISFAYENGSTDNTSVISIDFNGGITRKLNPINISDNQTCEEKSIIKKSYIVISVSLIVILLISYGIYDYVYINKGTIEADSVSTSKKVLSSHSTDSLANSDSLFNQFSPPSKTTHYNIAKGDESLNSSKQTLILSEEDLKWNASSSDDPIIIEADDYISLFEYDTKDRFYLTRINNQDNHQDTVSSFKRHKLEVVDYLIHFINSDLNIDTTISSKTTRLSNSETNFLRPGTYKIQIEAILNNGDVAKSNYIKLIMI